jgi:hypothetical protein
VLGFTALLATGAVLATLGGAHAASVGAAGVAADATLVFSAIADIQQDYTSEITVLEQQVSRHNTYSPSELLLHLGDIKGGSEPCEEFRYQHVADILKSSVVPVFVMPGDNDTVDCAAAATGWSLWKKYFLRIEDFFCGTPATERQNSRPENIAFVELIFVGPGPRQRQPDRRRCQLRARSAGEEHRARRCRIGTSPGSSSFAPFFDDFAAAAATAQAGSTCTATATRGSRIARSRPPPTCSAHSSNAAPRHRSRSR